jgi:hypothetical protein
MNKSRALLVIGFAVMGFLGFLSAATGSLEEKGPVASQAQEAPKHGWCTGSIPGYVLRCTDGAIEGPFWEVRYGECQIIPACTDHDGPIYVGGPIIAGAGETCNDRLPPEFAIYCAEDLTCIRDEARLDSSGTCMATGHLGDPCDSTPDKIRWVHCEQGLQCTPPSIPIAIGIVRVMTCQQ